MRVSSPTSAVNRAMAQLRRDRCPYDETSREIWYCGDENSMNRVSGGLFADRSVAAANGP
jgi:hypothetical protein